MYGYLHTLQYILEIFVWFRLFENVKKQVHEKYAYNCYEKLWFFRCFSAFLTQYPSHPQIKTGGHIFSILFWENSSGSWGCLFTSCLSYVKNNIESNIDWQISSLLLVIKIFEKISIENQIILSLSIIFTNNTYWRFSRVVSMLTPTSGTPWNDLWINFSRFKVHLTLCKTKSPAHNDLSPPNSIFIIWISFLT